MHNIDDYYDKYEVIGIEKVVDGDTVDLHLWRSTTLDAFDATISITSKGIRRLRLLGIDTPERGQPGYKEARDYLANWLIENENIFVVMPKRDNFGRNLAWIINYDTDECVNESLVDAGHAVIYRA